MSKKAVLGGVFAVAMAVIIIAGVLSVDWGFEENEEPASVPFAPDDTGKVAENSINYVLFEKWGPIMLILGAVMFGAIIAGVTLSKEDEDTEEEAKE